MSSNYFNQFKKVGTEVKNDLVESFMRQINNFYQITSQKKTQNWLQVGERLRLWPLCLLCLVATFNGEKI
jgi:hypothetical protein